MASVFLSYDREDAAKARSLALALEKAGCTVWWDLHVRGGTQFAKAIEQALRESDAVVVLWSGKSVDSAWVRDEAAAGRDANKLVPATIDGTEAPLGFRQYQTIDLAGRKSRSGSKEFRTLLDAIDNLSSKSGPRRTSEPPPQRGPLLKWLAIAGVVMLALVGLSFLLQRDRGGVSVHTVAVAAADTAAMPLTRDLLVNLGRLQPARAGSLRLINAAGTADLQSDLIFETASANENGKLGASLVLMDGKDKSILWSKDFRQESGSLADLKQQLAFTAARVLGCSLEGLSYNGGSLDQQTLKLYLNACADLEERLGSDAGSLVPVLEQVTEKAPGFAPGWAKLLLVQGEAVDAERGLSSDPAAKEALKHTIEVASNHHPDLPELKLAHMPLLPAIAHEDRMRLVDEAKADSPDNPWVLSARSGNLRSVGRMIDSIEDAKHAVEVDPLSPTTLNSYISALAYAGRIEAARTQLSNAERLWPGTASLEDIQFRFHLRFGDPVIATRIGREQGYPEGLEIFLRARSARTPDNINALANYMRGRATKNVGTLSWAAQAMGEFHMEDELYRLVLAWPRPQELATLDDVWFRPALDGFRRDPRFMIMMKRMGLSDYWRKSGKWPDFCLDPGLPYDCKAEAAKLAA